MRKSILELSCIVTIIMLLSACGGKQDEPAPVEPDLDYQLSNLFSGELVPVSTSPCFQGAYYRKALSSKDYWLGITGMVVLPKLEYDSDRINPAKPSTYLDNSSVYLGGNSDGQETDIGLLWEVIREDNGSVSAERKAFRPFMRRTGHSKTGQEALYQNAPAEKKYYWYPGDTVSMSVQLTDAGKLKFTVSGAGKHFETLFEANGYQLGSKAEYKRVNAIDQVANEGKPVQATKTKIKGAKWLSVYLYRNYKTEIVKAPMHVLRFTDMRCPSSQYFTIKQTENGVSEEISIDGSAKL